MKKALVLIYDTFAEFEISILLTCVNSPEFQVKTVSVNPEGKPVTSAGGMKYTAHLNLEKVNPKEYEILIIPGGNPFPLLKNQQLTKIIREFYDLKKLIAAICAGPSLLSSAGILENIKYTTSLTEANAEYSKVMVWGNKQKDFLVSDNRVITATGSNYLDFTEEVLIHLGIHSREETNPLEYFRVPSGT